jgi:hypothetical protein
MSNLDLAIRNIVQEEVRRALANLSISVGGVAAAAGTPARRGPGRPRKMAGVGVARRARASVAAAQGLKPAGKTAGDYEKGQKVRYMQGRGVFEAEVTKIDKETDEITVTGVKGVKLRPANKLYQA